MAEEQVLDDIETDPLPVPSVSAKESNDCDVAALPTLTDDSPKEQDLVKAKKEKRHRSKSRDRSQRKDGDPVDDGKTDEERKKERKEKRRLRHLEESKDGGEPKERHRKKRSKSKELPQGSPEVKETRSVSTPPAVAGFGTTVLDDDEIMDDDDVSSTKKKKERSKLAKMLGRGLKGPNVRSREVAPLPLSMAEPGGSSSNIPLPSVDGEVNAGDLDDPNNPWNYVKPDNPYAEKTEFDDGALEPDGKDGLKKDSMDFDGNCEGKDEYDPDGKKKKKKKQKKKKKMADVGSCKIDAPDFGKPSADISDDDDEVSYPELGKAVPRMPTLNTTDAGFIHTEMIEAPVAAQSVIPKQGMAPVRVNFKGKVFVSDNALEEAFERFDLDKNGYIGASEIRELSEQFGERLSDEVLDEMLQMMDDDGDGQVGKVDFFNEMKNVGTRAGYLLFGQNSEMQGGKIGVDVVRDSELVEEQRTAKDTRKTMKKEELLTDKERSIVQFASQNRCNERILNKIAKKYRKLHSNKQGLLEFEDFCRVMEIQTETKSRSLFNNFDEEGIEHVDLREFLICLANYSLKSDQDKIKFGFMMFDSEGLGKITKESLVMIIKANHFAKKSEIQNKVNAIMVQCDKNDEGMVPYEEFLNFAKKFPNLIFPGYRSKGKK